MDLNNKGNQHMRYLKTATAMITVTLALLLGLSSAAIAQEEEETKDQGSAYVDLNKPFVVNVGDPGARLRYSKVSVTLRVQGGGAADKVQNHQPWLRNELVFLLSGQPLDRVSSSQGQQSLQQEALDRLNRVLEEEEGEAMVTDVLFTEFVVQR